MTNETRNCSDCQRSMVFQQVSSDDGDWICYTRGCKNNGRVTTVQRAPLVYIAGPYTAATNLARMHNTRRANILGDLVTSAGCFPLVPHQVGITREGLQPESWWITATMTALQKCDAAIFLPGWQFSQGSRKERADCIAKWRPIFDAETVGGELVLTDDFLAWVAMFLKNGGGAG